MYNRFIVELKMYGIDEKRFLRHFSSLSYYIEMTFIGISIL